MIATEATSHQFDPAIAVAERQLPMLAEAAQMALVVSRGFAAAALAAANAVEIILDDEIWQPETGRARALAGAKDAAEAFQKVSRSLRLTLTLEMKTAELLRDLRAGIVSKTIAKHGGETPADHETPVAVDRRRPAGSCSSEGAVDLDKSERDFERLVEFDRPDRLPNAPFRQTVDQICDDIGVAPDWKNWKIGRPKLQYRPLEARPPGWSECRPRGALAPDQGLAAPASSP